MGRLPPSVYLARLAEHDRLIFDLLVNILASGKSQPPIIEEQRERIRSGALGGTTSAEPPVRKVLTAVPTGKPGKQQFVRTRVGDEWRAECGLLKLEGDERPYIVDREAAQYVALDIKRVQLRLGIDRQGNLFLWPVPLPATDIAENTWNLSQRQIADLAERRWVRMTSNRTIGAYEAFEAGAEIPEPTWPDLTFAEILEIAFGHGHVIDDRDHPALRTLRGEL